ncbi:MAG: transketolase C-terminal domain-containing protein [Candidatus Woesebacteria bacterium]|jgi:transketolase
MQNSVENIYLADYLNNPSYQATRDGFGDALVQAAEKNQNIVALSADLTSSLRLTAFEEKFPKRLIQVGVAEQNLMGVAAGLALGGKVPFATSYAVFNPGRNWDQLRVSVCYSNLNVKVVGGHAGVNTGADGASHQALEDIALTRVLPNMTVVVPCDYQEACKATAAIAKFTGPAYLRLNREKTLDITTENTPFEIGKAVTLRQGTDATIIACGTMVAEALLAAEELAKQNINLRVINLHTIKPIDKQAIIQVANETGAIITAEDHQIMAGMGSAVAEVLVQAQGREVSKLIPVEMVAVKDSFTESGNAKELMHKYEIDKNAIMKAVNKVLEKK